MRPITEAERATLDARVAEQDRFEAKFERSNSCWLWKAHKSPNGYGQFYLNGRQASAHRASYEIYIGAIPEGMVVCHRCDVKLCVNPAHLFLGTIADNNRDMHNKGRARVPRMVGEQNPRARLTEFEVREVLHRHREQGESASAIARLLSVSTSTIDHIVRGETWLCVTGRPAGTEAHS